MPFPLSRHTKHVSLCQNMMLTNEKIKREKKKIEEKEKGGREREKWLGYDWPCVIILFVDAE